MWLTISSGPEQGKRVQVTSQHFMIGRDDRCDLVIRDGKVSRQHALLWLEDGRVTLRDFGSSNGTLVNGQRIQMPCLLQGGEQVQLGDTVLSVSFAQPGDRPAGPLSQHTVVTPAAPPGPAPSRAPSQSTVERLLLRRSLRRTRAVAVAALVLALITVTLFATGLLPLDRGEPTAAQIVETVAPATVLVVTFRDNQAFSSGTGWVLDAQEGLIVTNHHVVSDGTDFVVGVGDDERDAQLMATAPCDDLAMLRVEDTSGLQAMPLGSQDDLRLGDTVVAVGFPVNPSLRDDLTATVGVVSVPRTRFVSDGSVPSFPNVIQTDAAVNPGNSGGPLVSARRVLVGVNTLGLIERQNTNYAIGVDRVKEVTAELREGRSLGWAGLGLAVPDPSTPGVFVTSAFPGSAAEGAGFGRRPALIVAIDGARLDNGMVSYCDAVGDHVTGDRATFSVVTEGSNGVIDVPVEFE
ncbi:MAG: trypsin-like peptidase domain-containing protein [Egibacteraceae bacterium]